MGRSRMASAGPVFLAFLNLGLTSFGGPVAHVGYFRRVGVAIGLLAFWMFPAWLVVGPSFLAAAGLDSV